MSFGDGISWENHVNEIFEQHTLDEIYYKCDPNSSFLLTITKYLNPLESDTDSYVLLDCGCHVGRWCRFFSDYGFEYFGIDQSEYALNKAREHNPYHLFFHSFLWDFNLTTYVGNLADVAVCVAVLQHNLIHEIERIIPQIRKNLKDGGVFFFTESTHHDGTLDGKMSREEWIELAEKHGFKFLENWEHDRYIFRAI